MDNISKIKFNNLLDENLKKKLLELNNDSLNQVLLEIYRLRSKRIQVSDLLKKYVNNEEFFGIGEIPLKKIYLYNLVFFNSLQKCYDQLDISPINPIGTNSVLSNLSQNLLLSTIKNSEVCGDPTTALTLEAAKRRKEYMNKEETMNNIVDLATVTKVLRMQPFDKSKGYMQHFNLFGLVSAGRKNQLNDFNTLKIIEHIEIWLNFCEKLNKCGFDFGKIEVGVTNINFLEHLIKFDFLKRSNITQNSLNDEYDLLEQENIILPKKILCYEEFDKNSVDLYKLYFFKQEFEGISKNIIYYLKKKYPNVDFYIDLNRKAGLGYYNGICFHIYSNKCGNIIQLADGGVTDWCSKLLSDKKELSVTSGFGAELILKIFGKDISCEKIKEVI